jgi:MFS family permease
MNRSLQIGLLLAVTLHAFDEMALVIALPTISKDLGGGEWYGVTLAAYVLAALVSTVWSGDWLDRHGPSGVFRVALLAFALGLGLAVVSDSMGVFVIARALQGFGGGIAFTVAYSVTNRLCPEEHKSRMVAWLDSAWLLPSLLAPAVGGLLVEHWSWRGLFWLQMPLLGVLALLLMKPLRGLERTPQSPNFNALWNALRIGGCCMLMVLVTSTPLSPLWLLVPISALLLWRPLNRALPQQWWRMRTTLPLSLILHGGIFFVFYGLESFLPLYLIDARGMGVTATGLAFTGAAFTWVAASFLQSSSKINMTHRSSLLWGLGLFALAIGLMALLLLPVAPTWIIYPAWAMAGFGMGLAYNAVATAAMLATEPGKEGATATGTGLMDSIGIGLAVGIGGAIKNQVGYQGGGLDLAMGLIGALMLLVTLVSLWLIWRRFPQLNSSEIYRNQPLPIGREKTKTAIPF